MSYYYVYTYVCLSGAHIVVVVLVVLAVVFVVVVVGYLLARWAVGMRECLPTLKIVI